MSIFLWARMNKKTNIIDFPPIGNNMLSEVMACHGLVLDGTVCRDRGRVFFSESKRMTGADQSMNGATPKGVLRELREDDVESACRLIAHSMNGDEGRWAEKTMRFHFNCKAHGIYDGRHYFTYSERNRLIGMVGLHHDLWGPEKNVWLAWFAVQPHAQRRGVGKTLLASIQKVALAKGFTRMFVETYGHSDFEKARSFYGAHGFHQVGEIGDYLSEGHSMIVFMKHLKE